MFGFRQSHDLLWHIRVQSCPAKSNMSVLAYDCCSVYDSHDHLTESDGEILNVISSDIEQQLYNFRFGKFGLASLAYVCGSTGSRCA